MRKLDDLTGQKFGKLTVIERSEDKIDKNGNRFVMWKCICDCGKETLAYACSLRNGSTKSCGCLKSPDLTGKRFGMLVVERKDEDYITGSGRRYTQWLCKCDCGNTKKALTSYLTSGKTDNCGCQKGKRISEANTKDLTGQRFGKLVAIKRSGLKKYKSKNVSLWLCQCDCGNTVEATVGSLISGNKKSCGCLNRIDIIGKKIGKLTVIEYIGLDKTGQSLWRCKCDCGNERICQRQYLKKSKKPSCGCINPLEKHGMSRTKIYHVWNAMKARCYCVTDNNYHHYGGRGIKVCDEWIDKEHGFENFAKWMYSIGYNDEKSGREQSIDRIDVNGNYGPENCRLVTQKEQVNNERRNIKIEYNGKIMTAKQWSEELGIGYKTIRKRIKAGLSIEDVLSKESLRWKNKSNEKGAS